MNGRPPAFEAATVSLCGSRACNQDRVLLLDNGETALLAIADGLGGHPRGEVAAQLLIDVCEAQFRRTRGPLSDPEHFMLQCIGRAHHAILRFGLGQVPPIAPRTTAVLAVVQGGIIHWTHVGDSRLYLIRDGQILARTRDHAQIRFVRHNEDEPSRPRASLTRCLGGLPQPPTTTCGPPTLLQTGDSVLLCSDGLWGQLPQQRLIAAFSDQATALETSLRGLAEQAASAPSSDNVSAVVMRWLATPSVMTEQSGLLDLPEDPLLDQAIQHLQSVLEKTTKPKP